MSEFSQAHIWVMRPDGIYPPSLGGFVDYEHGVPREAIMKVATISASRRDTVYVVMFPEEVDVSNVFLCDGEVLNEDFIINP
jgi:hypothetical protein